MHVNHIWLVSNSLSFEEAICLRNKKKVFMDVNICLYIYIYIYIYVNTYVNFAIVFISLRSHFILVQVSGCIAYSRGHQVRSWRAGVPAEFSSNPNQIHLKQLIKVLGILETSRQVCWGKLELNSAGHRPSRIKFDDPWPTVCMCV